MVNCLCYVPSSGGRDTFRRTIGILEEHLGPGLADGAKQFDHHADRRRILLKICLPKLGSHETVKRGHSLREFAAFLEVEAASKFAEDGLRLDEIIMDRFIPADGMLLIEARNGRIHEAQGAVEKHENELAGASGEDGVPTVSLSGLGKIHCEG